jgi:ParB family transcriptional regulator, chromosome partitioning protein
VILDKDFSVRQAEKMIANLGRTFKGALLHKPPPERKDGEIEALANSLTERLGLRVKISFNGKGGAVTLNYANLDQLDSILTLLNG